MQQLNPSAGAVLEGRPESPVAQISSEYQTNHVHRELTREYNPVGVVEQVIVRHLARRVTSLELVEDQLSKLRQTCDLTMSEVLAPLQRLGVSLDSGSVTPPGVEKLDAQSVRQSRSFIRTLAALHDVQGRRRQDELSSVVDPRFTSDRACLTYLLSYREEHGQRCKTCTTSTHGWWIEARRCWECGACGTQTGIRCGTLMEQSPLPLRVWFAAIRMVLLSPQLSAAELALKIDLRRVRTVRSMRKRIHHAVGAADASERLVGLDRLYVLET